MSESFREFLQRKVAHDSQDGVTIYHCFGGETRFLTLDGVRRLDECVDQEVIVLTAGMGEERGRWATAHVHAFGEQRLYNVTLKRNKQLKTIRATDGHRWLVRRPDRFVTTLDLKPGQRLSHVRAERFQGDVDHEGVRHGFHFGDGSVQYRTNGRTYGAVTLWGNKRDIEPYFDEIATSTATQAPGGMLGTRYTAGMKGYTKELPALDSTPEYLYGWLAGYFAADGSISKTGQVQITSSVLDNLEHVRNVCTVLGIGTYGITSKMRQGFGDTPSELFTLSFSSGDMEKSFFLRRDHAARWAPKSNERFGWTVVRVEETDDFEQVYCAMVPETESFVLEDNIHTGNCPFCGSGSVIARSDGTVECEFCGVCFGVTVQPRYPAFPQTIDGQPVPVPGMPQGAPGDPMGGAMPPDGGPVPPGADDAADGDPGAPADDSADDGNPFAKGSSLSYRQKLIRRLTSS